MKHDFESIALEAIALTELEWSPEPDDASRPDSITWLEDGREWDVDAFPALSAYLIAKRAAAKNADKCDRCMLWFPSGHVDGNTCQCVSCSHDGAFDNPVRGVEGRDQVLPT